MQQGSFILRLSKPLAKRQASASERNEEQYDVNRTMLSEEKRRGEKKQAKKFGIARTEHTLPLSLFPEC